MGFAMAHYSMGFAMHYSKEKFRKLSPKTDTCDCRLHFHSAWNVFCIAALLLNTSPTYLWNVSFRTQDFHFGKEVWRKPKKREKRNSCIKMSFEELLALRGKKLAGKFSAPKTGGLEKEDEGVRHHELWHHHRHHHKHRHQYHHLHHLD